MSLGVEKIGVMAAYHDASRTDIPGTAWQRLALSVCKTLAVHHLVSSLLLFCRLGIHFPGDIRQLTWDSLYCMSWHGQSFLRVCQCASELIAVMVLKAVKGLASIVRRRRVTVERGMPEVSNERIQTVAQYLSACLL